MSEKKFKLDPNSSILIEVETPNGLRRLDESITSYDIDKNGNFVAIDENNLVRQIIINPKTIIVNFIPSEAEEMEYEGSSYDEESESYVVSKDSFADIKDISPLKKFDTEHIKY